MNLLQKVESVIWIILGTMGGIVIPIAMFMGVKKVAEIIKIENFDVSHTFLPIFVFTVIAGAMQGFAFVSVKDKREAGWIAPTIGFNTGLGAYLVLGYGFTQHRVYYFALISWSVMFLLSVLFTLGENVNLDIFGKPKQHPGRIYD